MFTGGKVRVLSVSLFALNLVACDSGGDDGKANAEEPDVSKEDASTEAEDDSVEASSDSANEGESGMTDEGVSPSEKIDPVADSDEDGLSDGEEAELGTDINNVDSDGDGYWDSWEVAEGSDPLDADDRIYEGNWPYNPNKDDYESVRLGQATWAEGSPLARVEMVDQYGDMVDLFDFAGRNPIALDVSTMDCKPCNTLASYLSGQGDPANWGASYPSLPGKIHNEQITWITVLSHGRDPYGADGQDAKAWADQYPDEYVPVFASLQFGTVYTGIGVPTIAAINPDMSIGFFPSGWNDHYQALQIFEDYNPPAN